MLVSTRPIKWLESWYEWLEKQRKKREKEPEPFSTDVYSVFAEKNEKGRDKISIVDMQGKKTSVWVKADAELKKLLKLRNRMRRLSKAEQLEHGNLINALDEQIIDILKDKNVI